MIQPHVTCVMLTCNRPAMARRAVECFRAQTYDTSERMLLIVDSGDPSWYEHQSSENESRLRRTFPEKSIGALRNYGNKFSSDGGIVIHWDSDDFSHPDRISDQVAFLQRTGADAVGYNEMLFYDTTPGQFRGAWLYSNLDPRYALGTSLCYWRRTWEAKPFPDINAGEDTRWILGMNIRNEPGFGKVMEKLHGTTAKDQGPGFGDPRMIATIHGGNTSSRIIIGAKEWARVPGWDKYCRERVGGAS